MGGERRCTNAISLDNLPRINQRCEVEAYDVHLEPGFIAVLNHSSNDSLLDFPVVQVDADFVTNLKLSVIWLLWGWHAGNVPYLSAGEAGAAVPWQMSGVRRKSKIGKALVRIFPTTRRNQELTQISS